MIKFANGDLLDSKCNIKAHQCNCQGVMGSGVAKAVKDKYPDVYKRYAFQCDVYMPEELLGRVLYTVCDDNTTVASMYSQNKCGYDKKQYTDYEVLDECINKIHSYAYKEQKSVAFPYGLGSVRGGGDWEKVISIIEKYFKDSDVYCEIVKLVDTEDISINPYM